MRTVNFRDDVLWAIAYKLGLDPSISFLKNQAYALASYINAWVRRLYDSQDWPEWSVTAQFSFANSPFANVIGWNDAPVGNVTLPPTSGPTPLPPEPFTLPPTLFIGKVLKVYLVDPNTTWAPVDTPFRLNYTGVHCGFEHGPSVWIKYLPRCPRFTANEWDNTITYNKGDLTYSPLSGECYTSKTSNNIGHDPSQPGGSITLQPLMTQETPGAQDNPGLAATSKTLDIFAALPPATNGLGSIPDPPLAGSIATIIVSNALGTVLATATHTSSGTESLNAIFTILQGQLASALTGFTVTLITNPLSIRLQNASDFVVTQARATTAPGPGPAFPLGVSQVQAYTPATAPVAGTGQQFTVYLTDEQVVTGATYELTWTTVDSLEHVAVYTALATDNAVQILSGLIDNHIALQPTDDFFKGVQGTLDAVSPSATFTIDKTLGMVSLHTPILPPGATSWDVVPFPFVLVDAVVRGAYADALKEGGQADKAQGEEQQVPTESQVEAGRFDAPQYPPLSDQQKPRSRYAIK